jgi:hypothetical protein
VVERVELNVEFNFVVLKSNQRKSQTVVSAEEKLKWNEDC